MMWALKVTRSTMAGTRRRSGVISPDWLKGRLLARATLARSFCSVRIGNSSSEPRPVEHRAELIETDQLEAAVAGDDALQPPFVDGCRRGR
jgi:hypothetical protein